MKQLMKKPTFIPILLFVILFQGWNTCLHAQKNTSVFIIGPSISQHFSTYNGFNEWHPGFGGEFQLPFNRWVFGFHGYYMIKDSFNHNAYWTGLTAGYRIGSKKRFWCEPFVIMGGIKKREYNSGKFGLFALPVLSVGYKGVGFNIGYIPWVPGVTDPVLIVQVKLKILSFHL